MKQQIIYENSADEINYFNFYYNKDNSWPTHFHQNNEFLFVVKGNVKVIINGEEAVLDQGDIAVCNSFDVHNIIGDVDSEVYVLVFGKKYFNDSISFSNILKKREHTEKIFDLVDSFYVSNELENNNFRSGFIHCLYGLLEKYYNDMIIKRKSDNEFAKILLFIQENYKKDIKIIDLAREFGYTKNYFSRMFNKFTGMSFRDYLNRLRIERFEQLIKNNENSINFTATQCGFNSINTYYRAKKKFE